MTKIRSGQITEKGVKIKWNETSTGVSYSDGKTATPSPSNMDAKVAYKTAMKPVEPPVDPNPTKEYNVSPKELSLLRRAENAIYNLSPGNYSRCDFESLHNVIFRGNGKAVFETGGRAIQFNGADFSNVVLEGLVFKNIKDYCIDFWGLGNVKYPECVGGFTLRDIEATNCGTLLHMDGGLKEGSNYGVVKNLVIDGIDFRDSPEPRSVIYVGNGMNYDISNCVVNNINYSSSVPGFPQGAHNGIFQLGGWGKFHDNKITNHQGNAVRSWLHSQEGIGTVEIFNNIVYNSSTYSAFELQAKLSGEKGFKPANAKVYNNTAGKLNTWVMPTGKKFFEGQMLDLYDTKGTLDYYNNLGFDMNRRSGGITDMINYNGNGTVMKVYGNKYVGTQKEAVQDTVSFKSVFNEVGAV